MVRSHLQKEWPLANRSSPRGILIFALFLLELLRSWIGPSVFVTSNAANRLDGNMSFSAVASSPAVLVGFAAFKRFFTGPTKSLFRTLQTALGRHAAAADGFASRRIGFEI